MKARSDKVHKDMHAYWIQGELELNNNKKKKVGMRLHCKVQERKIPTVNCALENQRQQEKLKAGKLK